MNKPILKKLVVFASVAALLVPTLALVTPMIAHAQPNLGTQYVNNTGLAVSSEDPRALAVTILNYLLTFLGIIAVAVILYGGFKWLTAGGNEDRIAGAKKTIIAGIIGLIIVIAAYAIVTFVINITGNAISGNI